MDSLVDGSFSQLDRIRYCPWVGREREMHEANALWQHVVSGQGQVLLVSGEPGVGKTRFVHELISTLDLPETHVLVGECYAEGGPPYAPLAHMVCDTLENAVQTGLNFPGEMAGDLQPVLSSSCSRPVEFSPFPEPGFNLERQRACEGFFALCSTLCSQGPLVLFVDDGHWADYDTLFLLRNLARRGRKLPLLIILTFRSAELESAPDLRGIFIDLNRERLALQLRLERLSREETRALLASTFDENISPDFVEDIYRQTEGNPFFIGELCKTLVEAGHIAFIDGSWHSLHIEDVKIPQTVYSTIQSRVLKLPEPAQMVLRMAAILGSEFDFETLKYACDLDEESLISALERAEKAQLITEIPPMRSNVSKFAFVHVLIPTTLRQSIIHVRRRKLHLRAAQAIETIHPQDYEVLAYQYSEAGEVDRACQFYTRAGDRALRQAPGEASRFYQAALDRWPRDGDPEGQAGLQASLGYCLWVIDDIQGSLKCFQAAYTLFAGLENRFNSGEMQRMMGRLYWQQANWSLAMEHYYQALAIFEQGPESVEQARAVDSISQMMMLADDNEKGIVWGKRALAIAERLGGESVVVSALNNLGSSYFQDGEYEQGKLFLQQSITRALAANLPLDISRGYYNLGVMYQRQCRYELAEATMQELYLHASRYYTKTYSCLAVWRLMWISWYTGRWDVALDYRSKLVDSNDVLYTTWMKRVLGMIDLDLGREKEALGELEESLPDAIRADDFQTTVVHWGLLAQAYAATGQDEKMAGTIQQLLEFVSTRSFQSHETIMPLLIACQLMTSHNMPDFLDKARTSLSLLKRLDQKFKTEETAAALAEARGGVLLAEKRVPAAVEQFRQAASAWEKIERRLDQVRALGSLSKALQVLPDPEEMQAACQQAEAIISSLAGRLDQDLRKTFLASPMIGSIHSLARPVPTGRLPQFVDDPVNPLTGREAEVLKLVGEGLTNAQIAKVLYLSRLTVNAHLRSIFNKLDVATRTAAVHRAMELGLV